MRLSANDNDAHADAQMYWDETLGTVLAINVLSG